jgi:hypothetical protein
MFNPEQWMLNPEQWMFNPARYLEVLWGVSIILHGPEAGMPLSLEP